jgi:hypothetical protein
MTNGRWGWRRVDRRDMDEERPIRGVKGIREWIACQGSGAGGVCPCLPNREHVGRLAGNSETDDKEGDHA